ncbi:hypothetical protein FQA39_LY02448 [Lamprigera yunnana]|nr:hypothetical protein FQA39_LY02448 [Lamprigera yunnana]
MYYKSLLFLLACALLNAAALENAASYRLPQNVRPIRYHLKIVPHFPEKTFEGTVSIEVDVLEDTTSITLHSYNLNLPSKDEILVKEADTNNKLNIIFAGSVESIDHQFFKIQLSETLHKNQKYIITIPSFDGSFSPYFNGFIANTYTDIDGTIRVYPDFEDVYEETVEMPVYLVAFTISEMRFSETFDDIRIIAQPNDLANNYHKFGLNVTSESVTIMEQFTSIPYALPKLDQVAIPIYGGGMENWGLIVYGDPYLLLRDDTPQWRSQITEIIAHEVGHQWFGNLVTPTWWEYSWLSEGFATYFQTFIPIQIDPNIDVRGKFSIGIVQLILKNDVGFRPLNQNAGTPSEVIGLFDSIAYYKGCSVIRMLEMIVTTPIFIQGVRYYLQERQFNSVSPADLYRNMQKSVDESANKVNLGGLSVADIMTTWDSISGFPVVTIERDYNAKGSVHITQEVYTDFPPAKEGHWKIPINFATKSIPSFETTTPDHWITSPSQEIDILGLNQNDWLIANKKQTSYYRVNYDDKNWKIITETLYTNHIDIDVLNRAQLIDDSMHLGKSGRLDYKIVKNLTDYLNREDDPLPWQSFNNNAKQLKSHFYYSINYEFFKQYVFRVTKEVYKRLGFEEKVSDTPRQKELRQTIINLLCKLDHKDCLYKSSEAFKKWQKGEELSSHLRSAVFCGAIRNGNQQNFEYLINLIKKDHNGDKDIIEGLACSKDLNNLNRLLKMNMNKSVEKVIKTVAECSPEGLAAAVKFISKNFSEIEKQFKVTSVLLIMQFRKLMCLIIVFSHKSWCKLEPIPEIDLSKRVSLSKCVSKVLESFSEKSDCTLVSLSTIEIITNSSIAMDSVLLQEIFNRGSRSIIIQKTGDPSFEEWYIKKIDNYVVQIRLASELQDKLRILKSYTTWNAQARFLIISSNTFDHPIEAANAIVGQLWQQHIVNAVVLLADPQNETFSTAYSWYPYSQGVFADSNDKVLLIDKCHFGRFIFKKSWYPNKVPNNLNGYSLKVQPVIWPPYVLPPKSGQFLDGVEIELINLMAKVANFSVIYLNIDSTRPGGWGFVYENGTAEGSLLKLKNEECDILIGSFGATNERHKFYDYIVYNFPESLTWCVPHAKDAHPWVKLFMVLPGRLIIFSIILCLCVSFLLWGFCYFEPKEASVYKTLLGSMQNTFLAYFSISVHAQPRSLRARILFLLWVFFALHITALYQSSLVSVLTKPTYKQEINTLSGILEHDLNIWILSTMKRYFMENNTVNNKIHAVWKICKNINDCLNDTAFSKASATCTPRLYIEYAVNRYLTKKGDPLLYCFKDSIVTYPLDMLFYKGFPLKKYFKTLIGRITAAGMISHWEKQVFDYQLKYKSFDIQHSGDYQIRMSHLLLIFIILFIGQFCACLIFLLELWISKRNNKVHPKRVVKITVNFHV